jgi:glucosylceramidase
MNRGWRGPAGLLLALAAAGCGGGGSPQAPTEGPAVAVWLTTADGSSRLSSQASVHFGTGSSAASPTVDVNEAVSYQEMDGFGASLTESAAIVLNHGLSPSAREEVLDRLFSPTLGIGLSLLRQPMGASDFALSNYSYDDPPGGRPDPELRYFSIERDRTEIIPLLRQAKARNPRLRLLGTPWSPPGWMKTSGSMIGGRLRPEFQPALAQYFVRFLEAYVAEGLPFDFLTVQNEPHYEPTGYPGMLMEPGEQASFVRDYLGPALAASGLSPKILVFDHNWNEPGYPLQVLSDPLARGFSAGSAFHCYSGDVSVQTAVHQAYPDKGIWFTECSGGRWSSDFGSNLGWNAHNLTIGATRNWAQSVILWNLALDQDAGPTNGGCGDCRGVVTVDTRSGQASYEVEYEVLGHLSRFVVPGARRIESASFPGRLESVAFRNPDGSRVLLAYAVSAGELGVRWSGQSFDYTLPAGAVATFTW